MLYNGKETQVNIRTANLAVTELYLTVIVIKLNLPLSYDWKEKQKIFQLYNTQTLVFSCFNWSN